MSALAAAGGVRAQRFDGSDSVKPNGSRINPISRMVAGPFTAEIGPDLNPVRPAGDPAMKPETRNALAHLRGGTPDCGKVRDGLQAGIAGKDPWARYYRGVLRRRGRCFDPDSGAARGDIETAADQRLIAAERLLAFLCATGEGGAVDGRCAYRAARKAAARGDSYSMRMAGYFTESGMGVAPDEEKAAGWFRQAAEAGDGISARWLALRAERGVADRKSFYWREIAAQNGVTPADYWFTTIQAAGWGDRTRAEAALRALSELAERGDVEAMLAFSRLGDSASRSSVAPEAARRWLVRAAQSGSRDAQRLYGLRLIEGRDFPADRAEGMRWLRSAADAGDRTASALYGALLAEHPATPAERSEAWARMRLGRGGELDIDAPYRELASVLSPEERESGERRLRELMTLSGLRAVADP